MIDSTHHKLIAALESRSYKGLCVKRYGRHCCLVIRLADEDRVFVNRLGNCVEYRHAWQVRDWLRERFRIPESEVTIDVVQR